jgi:hypothetical protein
MTKYRELVYMILDKVKGSSDDFYYTEDHIIFLLNKYRSLLLKQRYSDVKRMIPDSNYQTIVINLEPSEVFEGEECVGGKYLRSTEPIPYTMSVGTTKIYPTDYFQGNIVFVNRNKFKYTGFSKYTKNIIYTTIAPDNYLYFKSNNPQHLYLEKVSVTGIFEDPTVITDFNDGDILDYDFPIEDALMSTLIELVVKDLAPSVYRPEDPNNNAADDLSNIYSFLKKNTKSDLQKQLE